MLNIIPKVKEEKEFADYFIFSNDTIVDNIDFKSSISYLSKLFSIPVSKNGRIKFIKNDQLDKEEYLLLVNKDEIKIEASTDNGAFYGLMSLKQLMPISSLENGIKDQDKIQCLEIKDKPEFSYRSFMMDVSRHFFGKEEVMRMLDLVALYKINVFHFHISDDQGFRLDIPKYQELKNISSKRSSSLVKGAFFKKTYVFDNIEHSGHYTEKDIDEILEYAKERFIKVIPEIDLPGHTQAILAAYPSFSCSKEKLEVRTKYGISKHVMCLSDEGCFDFVIDLIKEIKRIFKSDIIHIGGDECPTTAFKKCDKCRELMKKNNLKHFSALQGLYEVKLSNRLKEEGISTIVWNEAISKDLSKDVIIQYWLSKKPKVVLDKIKSGSKAIVSPFNCYYLDYPFALNSLKDTYEYDPYLGMDEDYHKNIIGLEAPIWTEWVCDRDRLDFQVFPRLIAVAESAWTSPNNRFYEDFMYRLNKHLEMLRTLKVNYPQEESFYLESNRKLWTSMISDDDHISNIEYKKWNRSNK